MIVQELTPAYREVELAFVLDELQRDASALEPFCDEVIDFCHAYSRQLFTDPEARRYPELQALAFWMRKAELLRMRQEFATLNVRHVRMVPRGLVFHIPPANVDTISIYSWLLAVLTGNRNIARISPRASSQTQILIRLLNSELARASAAMRESTRMISYGHEQAITAEISRACDVRVIWGGDATVNLIRAIPLAPHGRDLTFPDRYSLCAVNAAALLDYPEQQRTLAVKFFNDIFWFDQMACSSPRLIAWCGTPSACADASQAFYRAVGDYATTRGLSAEPATRIAKFTFACRAILDRPVVSYSNYGNELSVVALENLATASREHCGGGLLYQVFLEQVKDLLPFVDRKDQTLTHFGFEIAELEDLVQKLNGRGLDRLVPVGEALSFGRYWDGMDLFQEMTRAIYLDPGARPKSAP